MKVELQVQREVKNILEAVQSTIFTNVIQVTRKGKLPLSTAELNYLKSVVDSSVEQAFANGSRGLSQLCAQLEARIADGENRRS